MYSIIFIDILDFMLMEDLVHNYTLPCIMDLKMGNVMHSSYTDEEKYAKQKAKVNASTSKTLGLRIAGTQVSHMYCTCT